MDARQDGAVGAGAVVERELQQLLALRHGDAFLHLHGAEIGLAERIEIDLVLEHRLDDHIREVDWLGGRGSLRSHGHGSRGRSSRLRPAGGRLVAHMREQQHVADGRRIGEQHGQAVDADAHATGRRHAVFQRADVVGVEAHGLVVAQVLRLNLRAEALGLINRVVQLGEGVGVLMAADEQLEALGQLRVVLHLLGQRRNLQRMLGDERRLHQLLLGHGLEDLGDQLALAPSVLGMPAVLLQNGHQVLAAALERHLFAGIARGQPAHRLARPLARKVDVGALVAHLERPASRLRSGLDEALRQVHHAVQVGKRLVGLHRGELGVVVRVHALVAELTADLEHLLETAHQQALQRQLGRDAQIVIAVERVEVRDERLGVRAAEDRMQKRRLNLVEALLLHVAADGRDDLEALLEGLLDLGIHHQVDVTLTITRFFVGQAVELLGQRADGLRKQLEGRDGHGELTALRAHHRALDADPVAHIQVFDLGVHIFAERVDAAEQLDVARRVAQAEEGDLALHALGHDAAGNLHGVLGGGAIFQVSVLFVQVSQVMAVIESVAVRVLARIEQRLALSLANLDRVVFDDFRVVAHARFLSATMPSRRTRRREIISARS